MKVHVLIHDHRQGYECYVLKTDKLVDQLLASIIRQESEEWEPEEKDVIEEAISQGWIKEYALESFPEATGDRQWFIISEEKLISRSEDIQ
jgi:hypothetical protein